jgi:EAL domain-containing protein (putative c-di-GMP-specific phosphodiesterase class I)
MPVIAPENDSDLDELLLCIDSHPIKPAFQPIVDLRHGVAAGFEVLSRGPEPYRAPEILFQRAREIGVTWELERACRLAALTAIACLPEAFRSRHTFFLNFSPDVLNDPRFESGFTCGLLDAHGIALTNIVIEITERASIRDYAAFEAVVRHYADQGYRIALDDFGAGHSDLVTLISCVPHYLKLDMAVTRRVDREPYKERIVRSVVELARNVGAVLIAEGVETWGEAETLMRCGIEWAQGFLFGRPEPRPEQLRPIVSRQIVHNWMRTHRTPSISSFERSDQPMLVP